MNSGEQAGPTDLPATQKVMLVTGATGGIGQVTALELARLGHRVLLTARNAAKGEAVRAEIQTQTGNPALELYVGDLSRMADVRRIALEVRARHARLDVLVNNAGGLFSERRTTPDGFEYTFAFNHLAYMLLTALLLDPLKAAGAGRVVSVSSSAHFLARPRWDDLQFARGYSGAAAYNHSKLLNVLFAFALARRLRGSGVTSNVLHPGIVRSGFNTRPGGAMNLVFGLAMRGAITPQEGARTSLHLATSAEVAGVSGQYFERARPRRASGAARDEAAQDRLWALSETLLAPWLAPATTPPT